MSVPYGVLIGGLGAYTDGYLVSLCLTAGYHALAVRGVQALFDTLSRQIDLALIDLPDREHLAQLPEVTSHFKGILIILGPRNDRLTVEAFHYGIDDYIARPFRADELLARMRAHFRRYQRSMPPPFTVGPFTFDLAARRISFNDTPLTLDLPSFALLNVLSEAPTRLFTATELLTQVWGRAEATNLALLDTSWQRLRHQVGNAVDVLVGDVRQGFALLASAPEG